ncbi:MAG TPA: YdcF family protein [Clostridia bacterium]|nr:YdcF family protein [Clostridia bacterium]
MSGAAGSVNGALRIVLIAAGLLGVLDTVAVSMYSNMNAGTVLPALLGLPLLVIGLFFPAAQRFFQAGFGVFVKWLLIAGYAGYLAILLVMVPMMYREGHRNPAPGADAIVVLGCGVRGERVSLTLARRLGAALDYANANPATLVILSGGQGQGEYLTEAEAMRRYLVARGFPEGRIRMEEDSDSTYTNFLNSKRIIDGELGVGAKVLFVTTRFHVFRAELVARSLGLDAEGVGVRGVAWITPNDYMRESLVIIYYYLGGKI